MNVQYGISWKKLIQISFIISMIILFCTTSSAKVKRDWSKVQKISIGTNMIITIYQDGNHKNSKIKGVFESSTSESLTIISSGHPRTFNKSMVKKIAIRRKFMKNKSGWKALWIAGASVEAALIILAIGDSNPIFTKEHIFVNAVVSFPISVAFFLFDRYAIIYNITNKI